MKIIIKAVLSILIASSTNTAIFGMENIDSSNKSILKELHAAAFRGDLETINMLFLNISTENRVRFIATPACEQCSADCECLGYTALHCAANRCNAKIITVLLDSIPEHDRKPLVMKKDYQNNTAFYYAALNGDIDSAKILLEYYTEEEFKSLPNYLFIKIGEKENFKKQH